MNIPTGTNDATQETRAHKEGTVARAIEGQTAKLPSDLFLWCAGGAIAGSLALQLASLKRRRRFGRLGLAGAAPQLSSFVGQWAPTILLLGLYNKIVKVAGSDRVARARV